MRGVVTVGQLSTLDAGIPAGPQNCFNLVFRRGTMTGFIVTAWVSEFPAIRQRLEWFIADGRLTYREDIQHGFENAPDTLKRLFSGANRGQQCWSFKPDTRHCEPGEAGRGYPGR